MNIRLILPLLMTPLALSAQEVTPKPARPKQLFTVNESPTAEKLLAPRPLQYWVEEDGSITCVNGQNYYTRALYGTCSDGRLETSDRPVFGLYMPYMGGNVSFREPLGTRCTARYDGVSRIYTLSLPVAYRKKANVEATIEIRALAIQDGSASAQGGVWKIVGRNVKPGTTLPLRYGGADNASFSRNGDLGVDRKDCFEFKTERCKDNAYHLFSRKKESGFELVYGQNSKRGTRQLRGVISQGNFEIQEEVLASPYLTSAIDLSEERPIYLAIGNFDPTLSAKKIFDRSLQQAQKVIGSFLMNIPDKTMGTLDYVLSAAADGVWDEESGVWQHGAIGWRMPLPGWRAAYMGDVMGRHDRARRHFSGYAASQVTDVDVDPTIPVLDPSCNLARATERLGNPMFTTGYIGRYPMNPKKINHYDMNLVFIDELLWHLNWTGDWDYASEVWPVLQRHLDWEKRTFDPDNDYLYDAYCCIWASDALYYGGGAVTHSSAYNYRANKIAAEIASGLAHRIPSEDSLSQVYIQAAQKYQQEAEGILRALNKRLWLNVEGVWAECQDKMGLQRVHRSPALWTIYHAIDSEVATMEQAYRATRYIDACMPHYPIIASGNHPLADEINAGTFFAISTTNWQPYAWSINNVALAEQMHTALAYWQAGRADEAYHLFKGSLIDGMYLGSSPGNIGQTSFYDAARGECYRDFGDPVGITARTLVQGLFGVIPNLLHNRVVLRPGFPSAWDGQEVSLKTPDFNYGRRLVKGKMQYYFEGKGAFAQAEIIWDTTRLEGRMVETIEEIDCSLDVSLCTRDWPEESHLKRIDLSEYYNLEVADLFAQKYLFPRSETVTLSMPTQGMGEWCHPRDSFAIARDLGLKAIFTSLYDNFPRRQEILVSEDGRGLECSHLYFKLCGTTNPMQSRISNGVIRLRYTDGSQDRLWLVNPINWWPIEQDLLQGLPAFYLQSFKNDIAPPLRMSLRTGEIYRPHATQVNQPTDGGAATLLDMPIPQGKKLLSVELETLSNDVVIGMIDLLYE